MQKTVLITGSTDGIGREAAFRLAAKGYRILVHGRDPEKVNRLVKELKAQYKTENITGYVADFSVLNEVEIMVNALLENEQKLDILLNNAGVIMKSFQLSQDGFETTFAVNHLAHFYLTGELMPLLKTAERAKIINLTSMIHSNSIEVDKLLDPKYFESVNTYSLSKLCNILFTFKLSEHLIDEDITVNCMHPGVINTKMLKETWGAMGSPVEEGADREVFLVESEITESETGKYFQNNRVSDPSEISYDKSVQKALWDLSFSLLNEAGIRTDYLYK